MEYTLIYSGILGIITILTLLISKLYLPRSGRRLPPSPRSFPIIGHLHLLSSPLHHVLAQISTSYGPVILLRFGSRPVLLVNSPSAAEECFTKNDIVFANRPHSMARDHLSYNYSNLVAASYGPLWRNLRRFSTLEIFSSVRTSALADLREGEVRALVRQLFCSSVEGFQHVEMKSKFFELTANMIMQMLVGKRYYGENGTVGRDEGQRFQKMIEESFYVSAPSSNPDDFLPFLRFIGLNKFKKRLLNLRKEMDDLLQAMVEEQRRTRLSNGKEEELRERKTMMDVMLSLQEKDEDHFYTDILIKGTMMDLITVGTDTSAGTLEWALSLLLNHPESLKKAQLEIDTHVGHDRLISDSDLSRLPYLHLILKETLRLFPAGPFLVPHESSADCTVAGYDIPRGTMLLVNAYAIHRDPALWDQPTRFIPERFEGDEQSVKGSSKMMPFGIGRRRCPGEGMAMRLMALGLGALIQCFEWKRVGGELVDMTEGQGINLPKVVPLEAMYKPRSAMMDLLQRL